MEYTLTTSKGNYKINCEGHGIYINRLDNDGKDLGEILVAHIHERSKIVDDCMRRSTIVDAVKEIAIMELTEPQRDRMFKGGLNLGDCMML